jgi:hypothetical protein
MLGEGQCAECDQLVIGLQAESYGLHTEDGEFSYLAEWGGSPTWVPANPPFYGAVAKIEVLRTHSDVTFLDIARNCIVIQLVKGYRALQRAGSSGWEYDDLYNNPDNYLVDGPVGGTDPNWLSYEKNSSIEGDRVFIWDTPKHPVAPGEAVLWEEEFVTLVYDKSVLRRLTLRPFDIVGSVGELNTQLDAGPVAQFVWHLNNAPDGWTRPIR